jgi:transaldolase
VKNSADLVMSKLLLNLQIKEGVMVAIPFSDMGIKSNVTLVFSAGQAFIIAKVGATYKFSPFIGRLDDVQLMDQYFD